MALQARYRWRLPDGTAPDPGLLSAARERGLGERLARVLAARGHRSPADLAAFFDAAEAGLNDPALLPDAVTVLERIGHARSAGERLLVFGDFDADGVTGLAVLVRALRRLGLDAAPYVPSRLSEGHGLSLAAVERARAEGRSLIVTVDCGTTSVAEVTAARAAGIDVIVTDHHHVPERLPDAVAVVNPHRPGSRYPDARLAGSGVAFTLARLLLPGMPDAAGMVPDLAALAVIGTVADVAPMVGENRAIARIGLERLRSAPPAGIAALLVGAGLRSDRIDLDSIAYAIAPRLNAGGRMGDATTAADLLLTDDPAAAERLAGELEIANLARRELTRSVLDEARRSVEAQPGAGATIVAGEWPVGIIGLVAGRLAEERGRPAVVLSSAHDPWRASARSAGGFDLAAAFEACGDLFARHGGHPQAAGGDLPAALFEPFRERFLALAGAAPLDPRPELGVDVVLTAHDLGYGLLRELAALEPTGPGNPAPLVGVSGLSVTRVRPAGEGHAQLTLRKGREVLDGIAFERVDLVERLREGDAVEVVARLASRTFGGYESLQLELRDVAAPGPLAAWLETAA
ncbi:MAG TPA: single-stranded-DNA-specific exonuclease RecJ [Candidatus Limnocylindrales bacterium]|nr:single-stranded-DNA-specific exonuclease RecJ [Candidatus Limnocylindrales bacterium]